MIVRCFYVRAAAAVTVSVPEWARRPLDLAQNGTANVQRPSTTGRPTYQTCPTVARALLPAVHRNAAPVAILES